MKNFTNDVIHLVKSGDEKVLGDLYTAYQQEFIAWLKKNYRVSEEDAEEIFQFSIVTFYENIMNGKLLELSSSVKVYLFSIGKNKALELGRKKQRNLLMDDLLINRFVDEGEEEQSQKILLETRINQLADLFNQMHERCKKLLTMFYYERKSMLEIREAFDFNSEGVAKNEKYKCLKRLKKLAGQ